MQLTILNHEEHEAKCRRCGVTCHMPVEVGEIKYVLEELRCRFLGREGDGRYACTVYENRFEMAPWCHTADEALATGNLASDCPYAADVPGYNGRVWAPPQIREKLLPIVRQKLIAGGLPISCNPDSVLPILNAQGGQWSWSEQKDCFLFYSNSAHA